jgi:hypothetical protein
VANEVETYNRERKRTTTLNAVLGTRKDSAKPFLLIVDQFEEVFTHIEKPEQRTEFVRALWTHASRDSGISVIATLRVDFLGRCNEIVLDEKTGLRLEGVAYDEAFRVWVRQLDRAALEKVIQKPADLVGVTFDEGLVVRVLDDAGLEPGGMCWKRSRASDWFWWAKTMRQTRWIALR